MDGMPECSWDAGSTSFASFGDIPGNLCSPTDDWPRPFRKLNHDAAWDHLAAASNLHSVKFDPTGRWRADALNFQPCPEASSQDRYAVQQIHIRGRIWTLSAVFDGRRSFENVLDHCVTTGNFSQVTWAAIPLSMWLITCLSLCGNIWS
jgi:pyruvate dehydrogenase phosphatase